jgi:hypothetical protein
VAPQDDNTYLSVILSVSEESVFRILKDGPHKWGNYNSKITTYENTSFWRLKSGPAKSKIAPLTHPLLQKTFL